jgi:hypothetical protein
MLPLPRIKNLAPRKLLPKRLLPSPRNNWPNRIVRDLAPGYPAGLIITRKDKKGYNMTLVYLTGFMTLGLAIWVLFFDRINGWFLGKLTYLK